MLTYDARMPHHEYDKMDITFEGGKLEELTVSIRHVESHITLSYREIKEIVSLFDNFSNAYTAMEHDNG